MTIIEALVQLRNDLKLWVTNNLRTKVDKEDGKGLSSNDFTTAEKEKLAGISTDALATIVYVDSEVAKKADSEHEHDEYLVESDITSKADKSYVDTELAKKADSEHEHDEYLIESDITSKADKSYVDTELAKKSDTGHTHSQYLTAVPSEYVTETELAAKKYLTSVPSEYVTETELNAKGYLTQHQDLSAYAKKSEVPAVIDNLTSTSTTDALSAAQGAALKTAIDSITGDIGDLGGGDMMKATYDTNNNGIVDNAEKLGGYSVDYFAISDHTHTVSTTSVYSITDVGTLPSCTLPTLASVIANKCMAITWTAGSFNAGTLPTKGSATTVATGITIASA